MMTNQDVAYHDGMETDGATAVSVLGKIYHYHQKLYPEM
jgi:hypothetical protein